MRKANRIMANDPDLLEEYDFRGGVRGKYVARYQEGTNIVVLDPDVAEVFHDSESVNQVLRPLAQIIRQQQQPAVTRSGVEPEASLLP